MMGAGVTFRSESCMAAVKQCGGHQPVRRRLRTSLCLIWVCTPDRATSATVAPAALCTSKDILERCWHREESRDTARGILAPIKMSCPFTQWCKERLFLYMQGVSSCLYYLRLSGPPLSIGRIHCAVKSATSVLHFTPGSQN